MELRPSPGSASLNSLTDVAVASPAERDVLYVTSGLSWENASPDTAGLVDKASSQTIAGVKTFSGGVYLDNAVSARFYELDANGSNYIGLKAPDSLSGDVTYTLPASGSSGQFAKLGASDAISWASLAISDLSDNSDLVLLAGRAGSQTIKGSPTTGEHLILQSNASNDGDVQIQGSHLRVKAQKELRLEDASGGQYVGMRATDPTTSYTIELPAAIGTSGQVLQATGVGGGIITTSWVTPGATVAHGSLTGLTSGDDHTQYAYLAGRGTGQTLKGGAASGNHLVLESTSHATKGQVQIAASSVLALRATTSNPGQILIYDEAESHYCGFKAPTDVTSNSVYTMPPAFPGSSRYLTSDSGGVLSWGNPGGGGGYADVTDDPTFGVIDVTAAPQIAFDAADGFTVSADAGNAIITIEDDDLPVAKITKGTAGQVVTNNGSATSWGVGLIAGGGTGLSSYTAGDTLYYASSTALSKLAIGTAGQQLSVNSAASAPTWVEPTATEVESWRFEYSSTSAVKLTRIGNGRLRITINGVVYSSSSDVTASLSGSIFDSGAATPNTLYYAYVHDNSGTLVLDFSTTVPTSHVPGVYAHMTGFPAYRYVGRLIFTGTSALTENEVWSANARFIRNAVLVNGCRLSGDSSDPIPFSDISSTSSVYLHAYDHNRISLWNSFSGSWEDSIIPSTGVSLSLSGMVSGTNYDIFASLKDGSPRVELSLGTAWSSDTARAVGSGAITRAEGSFDGVLVKSGAKTHRYIGTIRATGASTTSDTVLARYIYSHFNQVKKRLLVASTSTVSCSNSSPDYWNASSVNRVEFVVGVKQQVDCRFTGGMYSQTSSNYCLVGIGLNALGFSDDARCYSKIATTEIIASTSLIKECALGYNYLAAVMQRNGSGTACSLPSYSLNAWIMQ